MCMIVCISANASPEDRKYEVTACKWKDIKIDCDYGRPPAIKILSAYWGRMENHICPGPTDDKSKVSCRNDVTSVFSHR